LVRADGVETRRSQTAAIFMFGWAPPWDTTISLMMFIRLLTAIRIENTCPFLFKVANKNSHVTRIPASGQLQMSRRIHLSFQSECKRSTIFLVYNNQVNFLDKCHRTDFQFQIFCLVRNQNHHKINSVQCLKWTATIRPLRNVPMKF
jgi:hypothetical protein